MQPLWHQLFIVFTVLILFYSETSSAYLLLLDDTFKSAPGTRYLIFSIAFYLLTRSYNRRGCMTIHILKSQYKITDISVNSFTTKVTNVIVFRFETQYF